MNKIIKFFIKIDYKIIGWIILEEKNKFLIKIKKFFCSLYGIDYESGCYIKTGCPA